MKIRRLWFGIIFLGLLAAFVIGCGGAPTPTPVPPTIPPTAIPPTEAPTQAPVSNATGGPLQDALNKVLAASTYRVDLSIKGEGGFTGAPTPAPGEQAKPITLVVMKGDVDGKDAHFTLRGALTSFLGIDPEKTIELITASGKAYLKGPVPLLGATEEKWYEVPPQAASVAQPPLTPASFLQSFGEAGINPTDFKNAGTETLDGQNCQVLAGDKTAVVNAFKKFGGATGATQEDLDSIDNAEFKFWVCEDGYLHQVRMLFEGHEKDTPDQKGSFEILIKMMDFDKDIQITPPADATPLQIPGATAPQVTPTP